MTDVFATVATTVLTTPGVQNVAYFLSDGEPTEGEW